MLGKLGSAILAGLLNNIIQPKGTHFSLKAINVTTRSAESLDGLRCQFSPANNGISFHQTNSGNINAARDADVVLVGCQPDDLESMLTYPGMGTILQRKVVISVVAGYPAAKIRSLCRRKAAKVEETSHTMNEFPLIRAMPNVSSAVCSSMTVLETPEGTLQQHRNMAEWIFRSLGQVISVPEENFNICTTLCSSGSAFFAHYLQDMVLGAKATSVQLPNGKLLAIAAITIKGLANLILERGSSVESIVRAVATPGGSTAEGLAVLDARKVECSIGEAFKASFEKLRDMERR